MKPRGKLHRSLRLVFAATLAFGAFTVTAAPVAVHFSTTAARNQLRAIPLPVADATTNTWDLACTFNTGGTLGSVACRYPDSYPTNSRWVLYSPPADFLGVDTFTFTASNGAAVSSVATCFVYVVENTTSAPTHSSSRAMTGWLSRQRPQPRL